jgi:GNAT superfamily N-acetyltransferase
LSAGSSPASFECLALGPGLADALSGLFQRSESGCFCEWWHFDGDKNAWLARLVESPETNRTRLCERAAAPELAGVVAVSAAGDAVGWMKLTRASAIPKLYAQRPYRGLSLAGDRERTMTVGCFLVDPAWRRRGVAQALLEKGLELARRAGASAVEAFPRRADGLREEELWTGPHDLYVRRGFELVHEVGQYPVLRLML